MEKKALFIDEFTPIIGGSYPMSGRIADGDVICALTTPGCWGPMITPRVQGAHEVSVPVYLEGAQVGDAVAIFIDKVELLSDAAASGTCKRYPERFDGDPSVYAKCPHCGIHNPPTVLEGIGEEAVRCARCNNPIIPQTFGNGYTVVYDKQTDIAVTADKQTAEQVARKAVAGEAYLPAGSQQHLATVLARADFSGVIIRPAPMVGNVGCSPKKRMPASKNTGDYIHTVKNTGLFEPATKADINDAHMDVNTVGQGSVVISPVMVEGAGVYVGDVHLTQGCGELAGHTLDVCARVEMHVRLLKGAAFAGPIILPSKEELNWRFQPFTANEYQRADALLEQYGSSLKVRNYPVQIVGTGPDLNAAVDDAVQRAVQATGLSEGEVKNRATAAGEIGIGRTSGCVHMTIMLEESTLAHMGLLEIVRDHYA